MVPTLVRFRPIVAPFPPVVLAAVDVTVHVADGAPPTAVAAPTVGAVPPVPDVARVKLPAATLLTGSENVTVHDSGPALVGFVDPAERLIELTVGAVVSTVTWLLRPLSGPRHAPIADASVYFQLPSDSETVQMTGVPEHVAGT